MRPVRVTQWILVSAGALAVSQVVADVVVPGCESIAQARLRPDDFWSFSSGHCRRALLGELIHLADRAGVSGGLFVGVVLASVTVAAFMWAVPLLLRDESPALAVLLCLTPVIPIWPIDREVLLVLPGLLLFATGRPGTSFMLSLAACSFVHEAVVLFYAPACVSLMHESGQSARFRGAMLAAMPAAAFVTLLVWRPEVTNDLERLYWPLRGIPDMSVSGSKLYSFAYMGPLEVVRFHASIALSSAREFAVEIGSLLAFAGAVVWALNRCQVRPIETAYQLLALAVFFVATIDYGRYYAPLFATFLLLGARASAQPDAAVPEPIRARAGAFGRASAVGARAAAQLVQARAWIVAGLAVLPIDWWAGGSAQFPSWMHRMRAAGVLVHEVMLGPGARERDLPDVLAATRPMHATRAPAGARPTADIDPARVVRQPVAAGVDGWISLDPAGRPSVFPARGRAWPPSMPPESLPTLVAVSAGSEHAVGLSGDGRVVAWGGNAFGQCNVPDDAATGVMACAGYAHSIVILGDGSVRCWGSNELGQCDVPAGLPPARAIAAGIHHSVALLVSGDVRCWGSNLAGQGEVPLGMGQVVGVAAGWMHSLAVGADGSVHAWGGRRAGQLSVPGDLGSAVAVAGGAHHSMALTAAGTVWCWGGNDHGQCEVPRGLAGVASIAAGAFQSFALREDGTVEAWGVATSGPP